MFRPCPRRLASLVALIVCLVSLPFTASSAAGAATAPAGVYFDDASPDLIRVGNSHYEIAFRRTNGSIASILAMPAEQSITLGSRHECLWGAMLSGPEEFVGGCHFRSGTANLFSYLWLPDKSTLVLKYEILGVDGPLVGAEVQVRVTTERWLDMRIETRNYSQRPVDRVLFPSDLVFQETEIDEAVLPILPGVALGPAFWAENRSYVRQYPGWPGLFADLVSVQTRHGALTIYPLPSDASPAVAPSYLGFVHDEEYAPDATYYHHTFAAWVRPHASWVSPWVRLLVGGDWLADAALVRRHTGLAGFPSLPQKLGARFEALARLPLYKADAVHLDRRFDQYPALFDRIAYPGLLHPVAWQQGGHDENYPDLLPPDPKWGTTADMAAMFTAAQALGFQVMPYSNPTWWDDQGPTLLNLPEGIGLTGVAALDAAREPISMTYGTHSGYVVSPWAPFVITRTAQLVDQLASLGADWQLWDQVGAREWLYDFNKNTPAPTAYMDGWLSLAEAHHAAGLMTEMGYDRLASAMVGFQGSVLLLERQGAVEPGWHAGWWRPVPLASALLGDKVLLYQHDLAPETMTHDKATLAWNLAMGYMLSADLAHAPGGVDGDWLRAVGALQRFAVSRIAGKRATAFERQPDPVYETRMTRTRYGDCWTLINWDPAHTRVWGVDILPPSGAQIYCPADAGGGGELLAGVFEVFRGYTLAAGDHVIIQERGRLATTIRHPLGEDTLIVAAYPTERPSRVQYVVEAIGYDGEQLGATPATSLDDGVKFMARAWLSGQRVEHYRLREQPAAFMPLLLR